ncbi:MAG: endonuclease/exonuclease/phosphatase family protein [Treponema sp.]|jgi:endonuclease/exonuclease/phosphatase family metal-dependent hydrolase|nr:endonuclease/exonuclease/phosphatase family protein [Treponema sp.]
MTHKQMLKGIKSVFQNLVGANLPFHGKGFRESGLNRTNVRPACSCTIKAPSPKLKLWESLIGKLLFLAGSIAVVSVTACRQDQGRETPAVFSAAVWNVQALFDGEETGNEYGDYRGAAGWNGEKYAARLNALSAAIPRLTGGGAPDLIALVEIENLGILEDLARGPLAQSGYTEAFFANIPGSSLGLGFLSRFPLVSARVHSIRSSGGTAPRPVLEIRIEPQGKPLMVFLCHWKSKLGGEDATEAMRRASARIVRRRLAEILRDEPLTPAIVMGDLNENYDEFYRRNTVCALLPEEALGEAGSPEDCLILSGEKPPRTRYADGPVLYSPWGRELQGGSYYYKETWETIDHLLLNDAFFDGTGWDFESCRVVNETPFVNSRGYPGSYLSRTGQGLSDHLPLVLFLKEARN